MTIVFSPEPTEPENDLVEFLAPLPEAQIVVRLVVDDGFTTEVVPLILDQVEARARAKIVGAINPTPRVEELEFVDIGGGHVTNTLGAGGVVASLTIDPGTRIEYRNLQEPPCGSCGVVSPGEPGQFQSGRISLIEMSGVLEVLNVVVPFRTFGRLFDTGETTSIRSEETSALPVAAYDGQGTIWLASGSVDDGDLHVDGEVASQPLAEVDEIKTSLSIAFRLGTSEIEFVPEPLPALLQFAASVALGLLASYRRWRSKTTPHPIT